MDRPSSEKIPASIWAANKFLRFCGKLFSWLSGGRANGASSTIESLAFFVGPDQFNPPVSTLAAAAVMVTVPVIILVLLFQRKIVAGLTAGAVKG